VVATDEPLNTFEQIASYNNFYEFGLDKGDPQRYAGRMTTSPWTVKIDGHCARPADYLLEDLIRPHQLEERIYRLRCVEAWSMVIPWIGIPLAEVIKRAEPTGKATFVAFETLNRPSEMPGMRQRSLDWPYVEGLRMDEAMHPLTILSVGPVRQDAHEPERGADPAGRALEVRVQEHQVDRPHQLRRPPAEDVVEPPDAERVRLLLQCEPAGRSPALEPGAREAPAEFLRQPPHRDVQRLRGSGRIAVRRHGPQEVLLKTCDAQADQVRREGADLRRAGAWAVFDTLNQIKPNPSFTPKWSDKPLLKSWEKVKPPLGWPRETDSLCPKCVREAARRSSTASGTYILLNEKVGEIKAQIIERDGKILMVKDCPKHGHFEDVMAIDPAFFKHLEESFPGRDIRAHNDEKLHNHGSSTIKYGRGAVLTIDLTNRCNMMCDPCFMDANQVGFVHELTLGRHQDAARQRISIKPRRQMSVQFSGGEPTLSPYFLDAVRYARKVGYNSVQAATNGIEFAKSPEFCRAGGRGGPALRLPAVRRHRQRRQLAPARRQPVRREAARDREPAGQRRRHRAGDHDRQRRQQRAGGAHHPVRARQPEEDLVPVVPAGVVHRPRRGDHRRAPRGAALHAVAPGARREEPDGLGEPTRDWFPISFMGTFSDWADLVHGPQATGAT
jgi:hypothetical protein